MERHPEGFGDALQLLYRDIFPATADGVQVLLADAQTGCQFGLTHVFFTIAFFKSILLSFFILFWLLIVKHKKWGGLPPQ